MEFRIERSGNSFPKKARTQVACESCRLRRIKCDGSKPICRACRGTSQTCMYRELDASRFIFKRAHIPGAKVKVRRSIFHASQSPTSALESLSTAQSTRPSLKGTTLSSASGADDSSREPIRATERRSQFRIPFFRWFGPTGIAPGYKKFVIDIKDSSNDHPVSVQPTVDQSDYSQPAVASASELPNLETLIFEQEDKLTPLPEILFPLLNTWFEYYAAHFPFHDQETFMISVREKKISSLLLNSMCALAARFSPLSVFDGQLSYLRGEIFANKAKLLLVPLMNLPSFEVVESILMIAWTELGTSHDVGLWMYTGMAVRMAEDLGMHKTEHLSGHGSSDGDRITSSSELYWAVNYLDHIICFATGRPLTTRRECIEVPLPCEPSQIDQPNALISAFPAMIRVMQTQGLVNEEICAIKNQPMELSTAARHRLMKCGDDLVSYYTSLPQTLTFDVQNFRAHTAAGQGGTFLLLHLWFNAVMIALHRPGLRYGQENLTDENFLCAESRHISLSTARTTSSILSLAELVDSKIIISSPFVDQAVEIAGLVFIAEMKVTPSLLPHPGMVYTLEGFGHQSNYQVCLRVLKLLLVYWRGIGWILTTMEQKYNGVKDTDPGEDSVDPHSLVSLNDTRMFQRLLRKVDRKAESTVQKGSDSTIGIAVSGTTNMRSKGTVTVVGTSQLQNTPTENNDSSTTRLLDNIGDDLTWESWLDEDIMNSLDFYQTNGS